MLTYCRRPRVESGKVTDRVMQQHAHAAVRVFHISPIYVTCPQSEWNQTALLAYVKVHNKYGIFSKSKRYELEPGDLKERSSVVRWADQMAEYLADKMAAPKD